MPATKPRSEGSDTRANGNGRPEFVRCELTAEQKVELKAWAEKRDSRALIQSIETCVSGDNYVLSLKPLDVGFQASLTPASEKDLNAGRSLVTRGSTPVNVLHGLFYKHEVLLKKNWSQLSRSVDFDL